MPETKKEERQRLYASFFDKLDGLSKGERTALKRSAGLPLSEADGRVLSAFYRCLPNEVPGWQEACWFAAACLSCLWEAGESNGTAFPQLLRTLLQTGEFSDSTAHRVEILLDTPWDSDGYLLAKLYRLIKLVRQKSDRARIDFPGLLEDLLNWNWDSQQVQRRWAREMFAPEPTKTEREDD